MKKAIVLSSGGVDSTTCISLAIRDFGRENVSTLSIYYGQKHDKELSCAEKISQHFGIPHYEKDISTIMEFSNCSLLKGSTEEISHTTYGQQVRQGEVVNTYVPFRNGLFLSCAATLALSIYPDDDVTIYYGAHSDDVAGQAYADCSFDFVVKMNASIMSGTYGKVRIYAPLVNMNKTQVVSIGLELATPYELTWSCYEGGEKACGTCATCRDRLEAFRNNGIKDSINYMEV